MKYKEFHADLVYSLDERENEVFERFYRRVFPGLVHVEFVTNLAVQRKGIDKVLHFKSGYQVTIDEKKRRRDFGDIALELRHEHDDGTITKGWLYTSQCDYIVYAIMPIKRAYLLPVLLLKKAWLTNKHIWITKYAQIASRNKTYNTISIGVPTNTVIAALSKEMQQEVTVDPIPMPCYDTPTKR